MPSTVSVRFAVLACALLAAHVAAANLFKIADRDMNILVSSKRAITPPEPVTALLVGGSGIHYGLNASLLSEATPWRFLNLGLILEGNSWENYRSFLEALDMIEPESIELVVYSSKDFYEFEESEEFTLTGARRGFLLFDSENWLQRLFGGAAGFGGRSADRTIIDRATGDMVFLEGVCDVYYPATEAQRPDKNIAEIAQRTDDLQRLFPNARILIRPWPVSEDVGFPIEHLHQVLSDSLRDRNVEVFLPPVNFYDEDWACDASFHPNAEGRDSLSLLEAGALIDAMGVPD